MSKQYMYAYIEEFELLPIHRKLCGASFISYWTLLFS